MRPDAQQAAFAAALLDRSESPPMSLHPGGRFRIYRNNYFAGLSRLLSARFPVVERLVGGECFQGCAYRHCQDLPPSTPVLHDYGATFPSFIARQTELQSLAYLADMARLEWARHASLNSADDPPLPSEALREALEGHGDRLRIVFLPSVQLIRSRYPIHSIWWTNTFDAAVKVIDAGAPGECVLLWRRDDQIRQVALPPPEVEFMESLMNGMDLGCAADRAAATEREFDATPLLARFVGDALITGCSSSIQ